MKKFFFLLSLLISFSIGHVWATDYELVYTLDGSVTSNASGSSAYATAIDIVDNGITWNIMANTSTNPWGIGGKNLSSTGRVLYSKGAVTGNILKIEIEHGAASSVTVNSMKVEVATDADFKRIVSTCTPTFAASSTVTVAHPDGDDAWEDCYYRITYYLTIGSSNKKVEFKSAKFYKEASGSSVAVTSVSLDETLITLEEEATQTLTATVLPNDANQNVTWESSDESVATVVDGLVTAIAAGDATITCKSAADATKSATCAVHVTASPYLKSKLIFTAKCNGSGTADDNAVWEVTSDAAESAFDSNKGIHYGTSSAAVSYVQLLTDDIHGTVKKVVVNASGASNTSAVISVKVGTTDFTVSGNYTTSPITASAADYTFTGSASGEIMVYISQTSTKKAIYCNSIVVTYESNGKQEAGLAYAEADQKKLAKLGDAFTAPTLTNPNHLTVSYASSNTNVAEVASNGAVTIKAVGVTDITASFEEDENYNAGSASYTIGVTSHAGTQADPYVAADAKIAIDVKETVENAYATGIVSNVVTTTLPSEGYITFYFSVDGLTSGQQIEAYKCFGLNSAQFEAVSDVVTGATVVVTGNLKKFNSTYEFDQNCHLVSYTAPAAEKTHINNTKETAYTVAQAITFAADGVTYDLDDYVYVSGVVYDVKSFNSTNGTLDLYIKDADAENQFELFKCAGINDGSSTTPFEALTDVQVGDEVIGYGQLTVYNTMSEFKQGNYLVELTRPTVAVESVSLPATETVEVGKTVTLSATVSPDNASDKSITWTVQSGSDYASVANGVVTGIAEGSAVIRATSVADNTKYAECTVTVSEASTPAGAENVVILAVYDTKYYAMSTTNSNNAFTAIAVEYDGTQVTVNSADDKDAIQWTKITDGDNTTFQDANSKYLKSADGASMSLQDAVCNWVWDATGEYYKISGTSRTFFYQNTSGGIFKNYATSNLNKSGYSDKAQVIAIAAENIVISSKVSAELAYNPASAEITQGDAWSAPALVNTHSVTITSYSSNNEAVATVTDAGVIALAGGTGTAVITAHFAGDASYLEGDAKYTITVNAVPESADDCDGADDFLDTEDKGNPTSYKERSTPNGWSAVNAGYKVIDEKAYWMINGKTTAVGVITSPELSNGIATLKFRYANTNSESNGVKVKIEIKQGENVVKEYTLDKANSEVTQNTVYTEIIENINVEGTFQIVFTNLSPSNNTGNKDRVSIGRICWTNYSGSVDPDPQPQDPDYTRTITLGNYGTICLPNGGTIVGAILFQIAYYNEGEEQIIFEELEGNAMVAGRPYLFWPSASQIEVFYTDAANAEAGNWRGLHGSYTKEELTADAGNYILYQNMYYFVNSTAYVGANRAYIKLGSGEDCAPTSDPGAAPGRRRIAMGVQGKQVATGISDIEAGEQPMKVMIDNKLYIIRAGQMYDMTGSKVK